MRIVLFMLFVLIAFNVRSAIIYSDQVAFLSSVNDGELVFEDWLNYPTDTALANQTFRGITYNNTNLIVGATRTNGWRLGFAGNVDERYRSFGSTVLDFNFSEGASAFGISLSQGNQNGGIRREGTSVWEIVFDNSQVFNVQVETTVNDFTGEAFFGLSGLDFSNVTVRRISSDIGIVWNVRDITFQTSVSEPKTLLLFGLVGLLFFNNRLRPAISALRNV